MRAPTLTELYAADPFLAILQQGFTQVRGNPELDPERLWQLEVAAVGEFERLRFRAGAFYSWINDYVTYEAFGSLPGVPTGLRIQFVNTDLATLSGFEFTSELELLPYLTPFASVVYVEGRDHSRGSQFTRTVGGIIPGSSEEPLPEIPPLESRLGIRLHQPGEQPRWVIELWARVVDDQDRVATSLNQLPTPGFTVWNIQGYWVLSESNLLVAGIENFTDKYYREHLDLRTGRGVFQPGVNFYAGMEWRY